VSAAVALGNLLNWVSDSLANQAAIAVGLLAASLFLCGILDVRLHRAFSALNARRAWRRSDESRLAWFSRVISAGLPNKDRLLFAIAVPLGGLSVFAGSVAQRTPAALLAFAGYFLISMAYIALVVRDEPTDRYFPPFD
jgi:hypothetical protein